MPSHIQNLIDQLISTAEERGIPRQRLATEAGMTVVELDTAREYGDILAAALVALGDQVDLELTFVARRAQGRSRERIINDIKAGVFFHHAA